MSKTKKLKVAIVAPPFGDTGGPEVVVQNLTNALLDRGVDVTLFAPADWKTRAKHIPTLEKSLWNMPEFKKQTKRGRINLVIASQLKVINYQSQFDLVHLHSSSYAYAVAKLLKKPCVLTVHNLITKVDCKQIKAAGVRIVALTKLQTPVKAAAIIGNGVPIKDVPFSLEKGSYLITIARLTDQKGVDVAIKIALKAKKKLLIFGRRGDSKERKIYFDKKIKPYLDKKQIIYKGEVSNTELQEYLRNAEALLFPIRRPEAFGLVAAEALACGTPVIGSAINPLPEILKNKKIAFLSNDVKQLIEAAKNTDIFDRQECRKYAERYFDSALMADKYIKLYQKILIDKSHKKDGCL